MNTTHMTYDLNLHEDYIPTWGAWEVGREIISNAFDADRKSTVILFPNQDTLIVKCNSQPEIYQLKLIGCSTKREDKEKIGQFGEGFKLAALVCTRMGGLFIAKTSTHTMKFKLEMDDFLKYRSLFMFIEEAKNQDEFCVEIKLTGIKEAVSGKFLEGQKSAHVDIKRNPETLSAYKMGVFIQEFKVNSVYDWNLYNIQVNRDRNMVGEWDLKYEISSYLARELSLEMVKKFLEPENSNCFELSAILSFPEKFSADQRCLVSNLLKERFGNQLAVSLGKGEVNKIARRMGIVILELPEGIKRLITDMEGGIPSADQVIKKTPVKEVVQTDDFPQIKEGIESVYNALNLNRNWRVFRSYLNAPLGYADIESKTIYLNEQLDQAGEGKQLISTIVHELAHIESKAGDGTIELEDILSQWFGEVIKLKENK